MRLIYPDQRQETASKAERPLLLKQQGEWAQEGCRVFSELLIANLDSGHDLGQD